METISIILFGLFVGICSYIVGLRSGSSNSKYEYDRGYEAGMTDALSLEDEPKYDAIKELVRQLDELFSECDDKDENDEL